MVYLAVLLLTAGLWLCCRSQNGAKQFLEQLEQQHCEQQQAVALRLSHLTKQSLWSRFITGLENIRYLLGKRYRLKLGLLALGLVGACLVLHSYMADVPFPVLCIAVLALAVLGAVHGLRSWRRRIFESIFPDALNLLAGAISSGESLFHAIVFVGDSLDNLVGREFQTMGQRLNLGQSADEVLARSCQRLPYPLFIFFAITLRANIKHGGQLKEMIASLGQIMFNSHALQKKKKAMTAEARMSAKIVASIPVLFLVFMKYMSPENYQFVMHDPAGRIIFYYLIVSELVGMAIIWLLMQRARG